MGDLVTLTICCGKGEHGRLRKQALEQLAADTGFRYREKPSISRLFEDLADRYLAESPLPEWFLRSEEDAASSIDEVADGPSWVPKIGVQNRFAELLTRKQEQEPQRHWTPHAVGEATGVAPATLRAYAQGRVTMFDLETLEALCRFFDCAVDELLVLIEDDR
jgi:DNA-binding Xre family transcriptional regulator